jgi:hypothetical protein
MGTAEAGRSGGRATGEAKGRWAVLSLAYDAAEGRPLLDNERRTNGRNYQASRLASHHVGPLAQQVLHAVLVALRGRGRGGACHEGGA